MGIKVCMNKGIGPHTCQRLLAQNGNIGSGVEKLACIRPIPKSDRIRLTAPTQLHVCIYHNAQNTLALSYMARPFVPVDDSYFRCWKCGKCHWVEVFARCVAIRMSVPVRCLWYTSCCGFHSALCTLSFCDSPQIEACLTINGDRAQWWATRKASSLQESDNKVTFIEVTSFALLYIIHLT